MKFVKIVRVLAFAVFSLATSSSVFAGTTPTPSPTPLPALCDPIPENCAQAFCVRDHLSATYSYLVQENKNPSLTLQEYSELINSLIVGFKCYGPTNCAGYPIGQGCQTAENTQGVCCPHPYNTKQNACFGLGEYLYPSQTDGCVDTKLYANYFSANSFGCALVAEPAPDGTFCNKGYGMCLKGKCNPLVATKPSPTATPK